MRYLGLVLLIVVGLSSLGLLLAEDRAAVPASFKGQVVVLNDLLKQEKIDYEPEMGLQLAFKTDEGKLFPLLRDVASRRFYNDVRLLNRPMQVKGRMVAGGALLQLLEVYSVRNGRTHELYYWCEVCSIKRDSLRPSKDCECCGGPMELREVPSK